MLRQASSWTRTMRRNWWRLSLFFSLWTLLGILDATHTFLRSLYEGSPFPWGRALALGLALWYAWALVAVFILALARRFPLERRAWPQRLVLYLTLGIGFVLAKLLMDYPIIKLFYCPDPERLTLARFYPGALAHQFQSYLVIYGALLGICHALNYHQKYQERELREARLRARLAQSQLQLLKFQLQPHFLFNTLNAIAALIHQDLELADRMVARLGDLLRLILEHVNVEEVVLREELEFLQAYVEIEEIRFGSRLAVRLHFDSEVLDAFVPYLILQPLVENAIRHGVVPRHGKGRVEVRGAKVAGRLRLEVEDDGPGMTKEPGPSSGGMGLATTKARLEQLYGDEWRWEFSQGLLGGLLVSVEIPLRILTARPA